MTVTDNTPLAVDLLAPTLRMGSVALNVRDMTEMKKFYTEVIGMAVLHENGLVVTLGIRGTPLVVLHHTVDLPETSTEEAGLYHLAILFSSRSELAHTVERVLEQAPHLYSGSADHLVSEAFYLSDAEGNGIELYYDRDPTTWQWQNGLVQMDAIYMSPQEYIRQYKDEQSADGTVTMGHVHLKIGNIEQAHVFYIDTIGFNLSAWLPHALFASVNRYHHHLGMNTWNSRDTGKRGDTLGLRHFEIILPRKERLTALKDRLGAAAIATDESGDGLCFADPWNNRIVATVHND